MPPLTEQEIEALDLFDELSDDPKLHLKMEFRQGDIQFLHNHQILHDEAEYYSEVKDYLFLFSL